MQVFRVDDSNEKFRLVDYDGIETVCDSLRETMFVLSKVYSIPLEELETGMLELVSSPDAIHAQFGHIDGAFIYCSKTEKKGRAA